MKKSLSLLLAIAMVFSMFATVASAATAEEQAAYSALEEAGIFVGREGGDAALDGELTRAEFASIIARLTGVNSDSPATFDDVPATHWATKVINAVVQAGYMQGTGDNKFEPSRNVTLQEVIAVAVRILGLEVDENATVEGAHPSVQKYIAAALAAGLIQEQADYTAPATRGQLAVVALTVYEQLQGIVKVTGAEAISSKKVVVTFSDGGQVEVELEEALKPGKNTITVTYQDKEYTAEVEYDAPAISAEAVGAKKIAVTFSQPVDDSKVEFEIKKSSIKLNIASKSFNSDKSVATIELSSKLTDGDYTVTAKGVEGGDLTATFSAQDERVTKIEFLSSNAPLTELDNDGVDDVSIPYQVLNQYGENITKVTTLITNAANVVANANNGTVDITGDYKVGDIVAVSLVHQQTATSAVQTFTVAAQARVSEISITGLYNKDNKTINEDTNLTNEEHYLLVEAKDQYGNVVTSAQRLEDDLIVNQTNTSVISVDPSTGWTTVDVNGSTKAAIRLQGPVSVGSSTITLISNTTGKNDSFTITVVDAERTDVINIINPGILVEDEDLYLPVEVFDKNGNPITNVQTLNNATKGVKVTFNGQQVNFVQKDDIPQIFVPAAINDSTGIKTIVAQPSSLKITTLQVDIKAAAVPTVIRGFDGDFAKAYDHNKTNTVNFDHTNLVIEDQYGRDMKDADVAAWLAANANNKIVVTEANSTGGVVAILDSDITNGGGAAFTVNAAKGNEKLTLTLYKDNNGQSTAVLTSAVDQTITVTDGTEYVSYTVDTIGTVYDEVAAGNNDAAAYNKEIKVYGVLSNGAKIRLDVNTDYTVSALTNAVVNTDIADSQLDVTAAVGDYGDKSEIVVPITVTIKRNGQQLKQDVTFSKVAPKITELKFVGQGATVDGDAVTSYTVAGDTLDIQDLINNTLLRLVAIDQYGAKVFVNNDGTVDFADGTGVDLVLFNVVPGTGDITISNNGTVNATVTGIDPYESFTVTITYSTASITLTVKR